MAGNQPVLTPSSGLGTWGSRGGGWGLNSTAILEVERLLQAVHVEGSLRVRRLWARRLPIVLTSSIS